MQSSELKFRFFPSKKIKSKEFHFYRVYNFINTFIYIELENFCIISVINLDFSKKFLHKLFRIAFGRFH